jgi:hypothetical protein
VRAGSCRAAGRAAGSISVARAGKINKRMEMPLS